MKRKLILSVAAGAILATAGMSYGAGFRINEQGAKAMGMANAFTAQADDPSALYFNPAGISFLKGAQVNLGSLLIAVPETEFSGLTPLSNGATVQEKAKRDLFVAPTVYATYSFENLPLTLGLGINSIYPLAKSWDASSNFRNQVTNISIKPINFQPTVSYRFDDLNLAVAAGVDVTYAQVSLQNAIYTPSLAGPAEFGDLGVDGTATDVGFNLGVLWKPRKDLSFGAAYRSKITLHISGDANFIATQPTGYALVQSIAPAPFTPGRFTSPASTTITLPQSANLGVAWKPIEKLTLELDAEWTGWSCFDKLQINFNSAQFSALNNNPIPKNWKDAWAYKFGAQYAATPIVDLRAGCAYDTSPVPDSTLGAELPDSDRHNVSVGIGLHNSFGAIDLAYMWVHFIDRTVNNMDLATLRGENGTFKSDAHLFGANVTIKF